MTTKQVKQALVRDRERKQAERAERIVVPGYPATHNPYLAHTRLPDCYPGCKITGFSAVHLANELANAVYAHPGCTADQSRATDEQLRWMATVGKPVIRQLARECLYHRHNETPR